MSDSDTSENGSSAEGACEPVDWRFYSKEEKAERWNKVIQWLKENYVAAEGVSIVSELVYKHYREHCSQKILDTATEKTFKRILVNTFPKVKHSHFGAKRGQKSCFYHGLDILETSGEYENIIKGRKFNVDKGRPPKRKSASLCNEISPPKIPKVVSKDTTVTPHSADYVNKWKECSSDYKGSHWKSTIDWLVEEYEVAPQICVLRTDVYQHYTDYCDKQKLSPAPQTIFGRMVQKAFSKMSMRRLGGRGDSKYYYMGIDVRTESDHYDIVSEGRMVSVDNKPKKNGFLVKKR